MTAVVADFDRIAAALDAEERERPLSRAERFLLRQVPASATSALDVGCGDGRVTRALAARGITTFGLDASPGMIALARRRTPDNPRIAYRVADVMNEALPDGAFDVVLSVSAVHHVPLDEVIPHLAAAVAPGGMLLIQDVTTRRGLAGLPLNAIAWLVRHLGRRGTPSRVVAALYEAHGADEQYLTTSCVAPTYRELLPTAQVFLHLEWRYTVLWRR
jgi:2-polyprenyl-3-methyl-5-hydroxy-6-metoxy-1,4-benzoquinol methylase